MHNPLGADQDSTRTIVEGEAWQQARRVGWSAATGRVSISTSSSGPVARSGMAISSGRSKARSMSVPWHLVCATECHSQTRPHHPSVRKFTHRYILPSTQPTQDKAARQQQ